jgi:hypothetical protein
MLKNKLFCFDKKPVFMKDFGNQIDPNWHEAGRIYPPYNFRIGFCQVNFYQKFPNIFGGKNGDQLE